MLRSCDDIYKNIVLKRLFMYTDIDVKVKLLTYIKGFAFGLAFGITALLPGLNIGTIAVFFNVYEKFFSFDFSLGGLKRNLGAVIFFVIGSICCVFFFGSLIVFLITNHNQIIYFCFIGMIAGCIPMVFKRLDFRAIKIRHIAILAVTLVLMLYANYISSDPVPGQMPEQFGIVGPGLFLWLFIAGFVSALAILIPGVSGAMVMLCFGAYSISVEAVTTFNSPILLSVSAGIALGFLASYKLIKKLLKTHAQMLYYAIIGFIIGSAFILYPGFSTEAGVGAGVLSIALAVGFAFLPSLLSRGKA